MSDPKTIAQTTQITIPRLAQPRHRPSVIGTVGSLTRAVTHSLRGPKSIAVGLFLIVLATAGSRYLRNGSSTTVQAPTTEARANNRQLEQNNLAGNATPSNRNAKPVTLHTAELTTVENTLTLTGTVVADSLLRITPSLDGLKIVKMHVQPGDRITAGQPIATLDNSILRSQLAQAEAQLAQAESDLQSQNAAIAQAQVLQQAAIVDANRYSTLYEQGAISQEQLGNRQIKALTTQQEVATAEAALNSAKANIARQLANIEQVETQLAQTTITAPTSGIIAERIATVGETASGPLYSLIEDNQLILEVNPSQAQLSQIELDIPVQIRSANQSAAQNSSISLTGSVKSIEPILEASNRKATVKIALPSTDQPLRPGMFLQANIITGRSRRIIIPATAVITQPNGESIVYIAEKTTDTQIDSIGEKQTYTAQATPVEIAPYSPQTQTSATSSSLTTADNNYVQVLSGLTADTQIVAGGASYLQSGDPITVAEPARSP